MREIGGPNGLMTGESIQCFGNTNSVSGLVFPTQ